MSTELLTIAVLGPTTIVVASLFLVMWIERKSAHDARVAAAGGAVLAAWALLAISLAARNVFVPSADAKSLPPIVIYLVVVFGALAMCLGASPSLRGLLTNQRNLIRLNAWRLEGFVFLVLMATGQMPALWALPAGIGDVLVGSMAFWVASRVDTPRGRRRAVVFNLLGLLDLVVAVALGVTTNPGAAQLFHTTPTSVLVTHFPLALVPTFLVPLAFTVHIVSLWQLYGGAWVSYRRLEPAMSS